MIQNTVLTILIIGHLLADFYFQTDEMAVNKEKDYQATLFHGMEYSFWMLIVMAAGLTWENLWLAWVILCGAHLGIDMLKCAIKKNSALMAGQGVVRNVLLPIVKTLGLDRILSFFIIDQALHLGTIWLVVWLADKTGRTLSPSTLVSFQPTGLPVPLLTFGAALLTVCKPVGVFIGSCNLWKSYKANQSANTPTNQPAGDPKGGRYIGYLERSITLVLLCYRQYEVISFVLTAKTIARFKEIENESISAEYYLIGTLLSIGLALAVAMVWGLMKVPAP